MISLSIHNPVAMKARDEGETYSGLTMTFSDASILDFYMPFPVAKALELAFDAAMADKVAQAEVAK